MSKDYTEEFSFRKEIEFEVKENLDGLDVDIEKIYVDVQNDELMQSVITLSILSSIETQLSEKDVPMEQLLSRQVRLKQFIAQTMMDRGIL